MKEYWLPEGSRLAKKRNIEYLSSRDELRHAQQTAEILEAKAVRCDSGRNLMVELGHGRYGIIPRSEVTIGEVRDIAIITQVGKPVCFTVLDSDAERPVLSRKAAQLRAMEYAMTNFKPGDIIPVKITHLEPFGAFVDIGCGIVSLIGIENISVSRISHPSDRFTVGQSAYAAVLGVDRSAGRVYLTHRELLGTWEENAGEFSPGETVSGIVRGVEEYGSFIELAPNLSGLTERREGLSVGDGVSVYIKSIHPERMKIKLLVIESFGKADRPRIEYFLTSGRLDYWRYSPECCTTKLIQRYFHSDLDIVE